MSEWTNDLLDNLDAMDAAEASTEVATGGEHSSTLVSTSNWPASNGNGDRRAYAAAAMRSEVELVARTPPGGRNHALNIASFNLASLVYAGELGEAEVKHELFNVAVAVGLTPTESRATILSGFEGAAAKVGARQIPQRLSAERTGAEITTVKDVGAAVEISEEEKRDLHEIAVSRRAYELRVRDEGQILWTRQRAAMMGQQPPVVESLSDLLAVPDKPAQYRVTDLWPVGGRVLLAAQYKAGKTSLMANLLRSLVDGDSFLGRWEPRQVGSVTLLDTELDKDMLRRWLRDQGVRNTGAVNVMSLRGRLSTFNILDDTSRAEWADRIGPTDVIMLDCLRPCLDAMGLSEDKDAGRFLVAFDALCTEASAAEALVVHHMGHGQERSRGDSRLLDWPDVLWKIVRDSDEEGNSIEDGDRFFSAMGRDVNVAESQLDWTPETRSLMVFGDGRADKRARNTIADIVEILNDSTDLDGLSQNALVRKLKGLGNSRDGARRAIGMAITDGVLVTVDGPNRTRLHILNPSRQR